MRPEITTLLEWVKPTSVTSEEMECVNLLKPGDYEMYNEKLNNILAEAKEIFVRMGITSMLRSGDLIVGIYTSQGDFCRGDAFAIKDFRISKGNWLLLWR